MNILFIAEHPILPNMGGIERVTYILSNEFIKVNNQIFFLSTNLSPSQPALLTKFKQFYIDVNNPNYLKEFADILERNKINIIINQQFTKESLSLLDYIKSGPYKVISTFHNRPFHTVGIERKMKLNTYPSSLRGKLMKYSGIFFPQIYGKGRIKLFKKNIEDFINVSDRLCLLSESFKMRLLNYMPHIDPEKIIAINNPNTFKEIQFRETGKENIMLFVGRLEDPQKNVKGFIDIWNAFYRDHKDWKAYIIGDGPHKAIFEKYALKTKSQNLTFTGNVKNVAEYYSKAKILVLSSLFEGWGMVLTEAMAYGCIPAAYDTYESLSEIIKDEETGIIADKFNTELMAQKISKVIDNEKIFKEMSVKAANSIQRFNSKDISSKWLTEIMKLFQ